MRHIDENEFKEWLDHPVTRAVREMYLGKAEALKSAWAEWAFVNSSAEAYAIQNAGEVGRCKTYLEVAGISYEDYLTENQNDKSVGAAPEGESSVN